MLPASPPTEPEPFEAVLADLDRIVVPGPHALAASELLRLLPGQRHVPVDPGRAGLRRSRRAGHALGHQPGVHRGRAGRPRLDGRAAGAARPLPQHRRRGRGHPGQRVQRHAVRHPRRSRAGHRRPLQRRGRQRATRRLRHLAGPLVDREGAAHRRDRQRQPPPRRRRRRLRHAARRAGRGGGRRTAPPVARRSSWWPPPAPPRRWPSTRCPRSPTCAGGRACGSTSTGRWPAWAPSCPALAWIQDGVDQVDSYCTNPHKWMGVNFDCDLFWVADRTDLLRALSILPEYLRTAAGESGAVDRLPRLAGPPRAAVPGTEAVVRAPDRRSRRGPRHDRAALPARDRARRLGGAGRPCSSWPHRLH